LLPLVSHYLSVRTNSCGFTASQSNLRILSRCSEGTTVLTWADYVLVTLTIACVVGGLGVLAVTLL
jgi:hypothetical protein